MMFRAPAKVNWYLRVIKKRPDGYHRIETFFERVGIFDKVSIRSLKKDSVEISCDNRAVPTGKGSLIARTVTLVKKSFDVPGGVKIRIYKKIPVAAGLGGGSSDAAIVIKGLRKLWKLPLGKEEMMKLGSRLGADVPFFLSGYSFARAFGIGDRIKPHIAGEKVWHLIIYPPVRILAKDVYGAYSSRRSSGLTKKPRLNKILPPIRRLSFRPEGFMQNDLEKTVFKKAPVVKELKNTMIKMGLRNTLVSGSGPSVFSLFNTRKEALEARSLLKRGFPAARQKGWKFFIAQTF